MSVGRRSAPELAAAVKSAAGNPDIANALHDLALDAIECLRAMLDHGTTEDRIAATKALTPLLKELNVAGPDEGSNMLEETRALLMGQWEDIA